LTVVDQVGCRIAREFYTNFSKLVGLVCHFMSPGFCNLLKPPAIHSKIEVFSEIDRELKLIEEMGLAKIETASIQRYGCFEPTVRLSPGAVGRV
jgi:hypothetical protein